MITDKQRELIHKSLYAARLEAVAPFVLISAAMVADRQAAMNTTRATLEAEFARLNARVEHLTALVKQAEWKSGVETCSACGVDKLPHLPTCRVFTPGGDVK